MKETWANRALDLSPTRPAQALEAALRSAIANGRLVAGTRLPASRTLAVDLGIARNTVADVFSQLAAEGWLESRVGAGTWVSSQRARSTSTVTDPELVGRSLDLRGGVPDPSSFPRREWAAASRRAVGQAPSSDLGYADTAGVPALRRALAEYVARARGVHAEAGDMVVGRGFSDLLALTCRALYANGARRIAVEQYGHEQHRQIISASGLALVPLPVDEVGADVSTLDAERVSAVLLTPAHQFPTGVPLAAHRRLEVADWAVRTGGIVIEDDYDGEFRYDRRSIGALQALAPQHVLYAGTASKALAPAVGLAWAVVPATLMPGLDEQRSRTGGVVDGINQLTLAEFMRGYHYDRHLRRMRRIYRQRREQVDSLVAESLPQCTVSGLAAGLNCLVELPAGASERAVEIEARRRGLRLEGLSSFAIGRLRPSDRPPTVVVGYGAPPPHLFREAVARAIDAIRVGIAG